MGARQAMLALLAAAVGVWVAGAVAQGDFAGNGCPPSPRAPRHPTGFTGTNGTGTALPGSASALASASGCRHGRPARHKRHEPSGEHRQTPTDEPLVGRRPLSFTFSVRLRRSTAAGPLTVTGYATRVSPPRATSDGCDPRLVRRPNLKKDQVARIHVRPPAGGWCAGRYRVTVTLKPGAGSR
jgi:hypothetical protein